MKKLLLFFAITALILTSCDGYCTMDFVIENQTESDVVVETIRNNEQRIIITPGNEQRIDQQGGTCDPKKGGLAYNDDARMIYNANIKIEDVYMPEIIWSSKYWNCIVDKFLTTYTLTITDELIEELLSTEEQ